MPCAPLQRPLDGNDPSDRRKAIREAGEQLRPGSGLRGSGGSGIVDDKFLLAQLEQPQSDLQAQKVFQLMEAELQDFEVILIPLNLNCQNLIFHYDHSTYQIHCHVNLHAKVRPSGVK